MLIMLLFLLLFLKLLLMLLLLLLPLLQGMLPVKKFAFYFGVFHLIFGVFLGLVGFYYYYCCCCCLLYLCYSLCIYVILYLNFKVHLQPDLPLEPV